MGWLGKISWVAGRGGGVGLPVKGRPCGTMKRYGHEKQLRTLLRELEWGCGKRASVRVSLYKGWRGGGGEINEGKKNK